ncbi:MAG: hypothetical protein AAF198_06435 [Pseudomonadota bacterium]
MDMFKEIEKWRHLTKDWLEKKKQAELLGETKNDYLAELISQQDGKTHAEKERMARTSKEWKTLQEGRLHAEHEERCALFRRKDAEMVINAIGDANASMRKEMRMGGSVT